MTSQKAPRTRHDVGVRGTIGQSAKPRAVRSKYGVRMDAAGKLARTVDGKLFASQAEARRFSELKLLEKAGDIWDLEVQPRFPLRVPSTTGTVFGAAKALAGTFNGVIGELRLDFAYHTPEGRIFEDVKGGPTLPLAKWKFKHFARQYGVTVTEIRYRR